MFIPATNLSLLRSAMVRILAIAVGLGTSAAAHALDPRVPLQSYHHTVWTVKEGAPGAITAVTQTSDGWLWLGTPSGLYRFDGVTFSRFAPRGVGLLASNISSLTAEPDGGLIVGYIGGGMSAIVHDEVVHLAQRAQFGPVIETARDQDGALWAATMSGLFRYRQGTWARIGADAGFPGPVANSIVLDRYGRLWAGDTEHLYQLDRKTGRFVMAGPQGEAYDIVPSPDGRLWRNQDGTWQALPLPEGAVRKAPAAWRAASSAVGIFDRHGNHWSVHCPIGLCRTLPEAIAGRSSFRPESMASERLDQPWQMSSLSSNNVFEDREGNIWVGTFGGLERFRDNPLVAVPVPPGANYYAIVRDEAGQALIGSTPQGHLFRPGAAHPGPPRRNLAIAAAQDGGTLVADSEGVHITQGGKTRALAFPADEQGKPRGTFPILIAGSTTAFWLGLSGVGLFRYENEKWTPASALGVPAGTRSMALDAQGATWIGNKDGSVLRVQGSHVSRTRVDADNDVGAVSFIDASHGVVISGDDAMAVLIDGKFRRLRTSDPQLLAGVSGMIVTANGDRWLNGHKGALHITARAWADMLARPDRDVAAKVYDTLDGYPGVGQEAGLKSSAIQDADGKLWFVGTAGVAWLDPARLVPNTMPPALAIGPLALPGARRAPDGSYALPPGTTALRVDYTALSFTQPERVQFRYRLEGVDHDWQAAGTRRTAFYTNLGPGRYRFRLLATNENGVGSVREADMRITIAPTVFQTAWFRLLCAALLLATILVVHRWRMRKLATRHWERFQERLLERERIARGLHDNLLQNFQALILFFRLHSENLAPGDAARANMDSMLGQADAVMTEARQDITGLRSHADDSAMDIGEALAKFGTELQAQFGPRFSLLATGGTTQLTAYAWNELHAVGREAIFNAYQHAQARHVDVELGRVRGSFVLIVRDDGRGLDATVNRHGRTGHFGLPGMHERARGLGGAIAIRPRRGGGTEVMLRVPAARVYTAIARRWRRPTTPA